MHKFINNNLIFKIYPSKFNAEAAIVRRLKLEIQRKIKNKLIVLSGGKSPKDYLNKLSSTDIDWDLVSLMISDERMSRDPQQSNLNFLKNNFLNRLAKNNKPKIISFFQNKKILSEQNPEKYITDRINHLQAPDLSVLSIGHDGHIASLFELDKNNINAKKNFIFNFSKSIKQMRVSLTFQYLLSSRKIVLFAFGNNKQNIIKILKQNN